MFCVHQSLIVLSVVSYVFVDRLSVYRRICLTDVSNSHIHLNIRCKIKNLEWNKITPVFSRMPNRKRMMLMKVRDKYHIHI